MMEDDLQLCKRCSFYFYEPQLDYICTNPWCNNRFTHDATIDCMFFISTDDLKLYYIDRGVLKRGDKP